MILETIKSANNSLLKNLILNICIKESTIKKI